jgi:uncharacterized HAD superfamily protein
MKYLNTIAYDFDGVLCDTFPAFEQHWFTKYDWLIPQSDSWNMGMPEDYDIKLMHDDILEAHELYQAYLYPHAFSMESVRHMANELQESPIIITARKPESRGVTEAWLKHWLGIPFTLYLTAGSRKDELIESLNIRYFVEDRFKVANEIALVCDTCFMPSRPWNVGRTPGKKVTRIRDLVNIIDTVLNKE